MVKMIEIGGTHMKMILTQLQYEMLVDRPEDCTLEALRDTFYDEDKPIPSDEEFHKAFLNVSRFLGGRDLTNVVKLSELEKLILEDYVDGSTWMSRARDAYDNGEIDKKQFAAEVRSWNNLCHKLHRIGILTNE